MILRLACHCVGILLSLLQSWGSEAKMDNPDGLIFRNDKQNLMLVDCLKIVLERSTHGKTIILFIYLFIYLFVISYLFVLRRRTRA